MALPPLVDLQVKITPHTAAILADTTQVEQALLNLCTNALLAIGSAKGSRTIELSSADVGQPLTGRLGLQSGRYVTVSVRDNGSGMSPETLGRIFEPFSPPARWARGRGWACPWYTASCRALSRVPSTCACPVRAVCSRCISRRPLSKLLLRRPEVAAVEPIVGRGRQHVMYVDDDRAPVFLIARVLKRKGFTVTTFTDPHEALHAFESKPQTFDLLVTDYNMPGFSGIDLLRQVKRIRPEVPVALALGYVTPELEQSAMVEGASALIYKPDDVSEFCETVQRLIAGNDAR